MSRMSGCWPHLDDIPVHIRNAIWVDVMAAVDVDDGDIQVFRNHWDRKLRKNYRCALSVINNKKKKPEWMSAAIYAEFLQLWETPAMKEISARNSANRNKNPVIHRGGSKPFSEYRKKLAKNKQREPTYAEVFTRTHAVEHTNDDGVVTYTWADSKSQKIMEQYEAEQARVLQATGRDELTVEEQDRIFDHVSPQATRSRRYGYGNQEAVTFQANYQRSQDEEEIAQLRKQVAELNEWRSSGGGLEQLLDQRIAAFMSQHGRMPRDVGSEDDDDDDYMICTYFDCLVRICGFMDL